MAVITTLTMLRILQYEFYYCSNCQVKIKKISITFVISKGGQINSVSVSENKGLILFFYIFAYLKYQERELRKEKYLKSGRQRVEEKRLENSKSIRLSEQEY